MNGAESPTPEEPKRSPAASSHRKLPDSVVALLGVFLVLVPLGFAALLDLNANLMFFLRVISALGGALVGVAIPGLIEIDLAFARGAGAMGIFVLIMYVNPPVLVQSNPVRPIPSNFHGGGKCLDAKLAGYQSNAGEVQVWDCHDGPNQRWHFDNTGRLLNGGGKCLDAKLDRFQSNGGDVQVWDCHDEVNQRWRFDDAGRLVNGGGKCLDAKLAGLQSNGGEVQVWDCHDGANQRWHLDSTGRLVNE